MRKLRLELEYEGTRYHGWQLQPAAPTIQQVLEETLQKILGESCRVLGAGRTDAGVHALGQVAHFATTRSLDAKSLQKALNSLLPADISIKDAQDVPESFHARRSALNKRYEYWIWDDSRSSVLHHRFCWHVRVPLDREGMRRAARHLTGEHDFSSFQGAGCESEGSPVRHVRLVEVECAKAPLIRISVEGSSFLRHMVRVMTGTLAEVGLGRMDEKDIPGILAARDRRLAGRTAPAKGLFLMWVDYGEALEGGRGTGAQGRVSPPWLPTL
ncbi:MAG: tRNA pseudouridine(38-40) synthase TruA [bacterium]